MTPVMAYYEWLAGGGRLRFMEAPGRTFPQLVDCGALWFWEWWEV
jgi:hypothetical protein